MTWHDIKGFIKKKNHIIIYILSHQNGGAIPEINSKQKSMYFKELINDQEKIYIQNKYLLYSPELYYRNCKEIYKHEELQDPGGKKI